MPTPIPPSPGSARPGELYVDLQSRALWLGVAAAEDPQQAVLISDIESIPGQVGEGVTAANSYTDSQVATRAPSVHTHTAAQITDFNPAVDARIAATPGLGWETGMIVMWSGALSAIGVGPLAGWALCDGSNGTPNLRDKFIIGAGNKLPGTQNSGASLDTSTGGAHTHAITVSQTALSAAQMPPHTHALTLAGSTANAGDHFHQGLVVKGSSSDGGDPGPYIITDNGGANGDQNNAGKTQNAGEHNHAVTVTGSAANTGGGEGHSHPASSVSAGAHNHQVTPAQIRETTPYYALAFIMKL